MEDNIKKAVERLRNDCALRRYAKCIELDILAVCTALEKAEAVCEAAYEWLTSESESMPLELNELLVEWKQSKQ